MTTPVSDIRMELMVREGVQVASIIPNVFLGPRFGAFKSAVDTKGVNFDLTTRLNWCSLADVGRVRDSLKGAGFTVSGKRALVDVLSRLHTSLIDRDRVVAEVADDIDNRLSASGKKLYGYQRQGARALAGAIEGYALFDDMGLGKTVQTLAALPRNARVVVVGPKSAKGVWKEEVAKWRHDLRTTVLSGKKSFRWPEPGEVVALNYQILPKEDAIPADCPEGVVVVFDEAQHIRHYKSVSSVSSLALANRVRSHGGRAFVLTATPLDNTPFELWTLLEIAGVHHRVFGNWKRFLGIYHAVKTQYGWHFGTPDPDEIRECLQRGTRRRMKDSVLSELPPKTYQNIPTEISPALAARCTAMMPRDLVELTKMVRGQQKAHFEGFSKLYEALSSALIPAMLDIVEQYESARVPLVVFSPHRGPIDELAQRPGWVTITGDTTETDREDYVRRFQDGELLGIAGTYQAMGTAVTLTRSSNVLQVNLSFTNGTNGQAEDRCRRIGQRSAVNVMRLIADHDLARRILEILDEKKEMIDGTITATEVDGNAQALVASDDLAFVTQLQR